MAGPALSFTQSAFPVPECIDLPELKIIIESQVVLLLTNRGGFPRR
jgi:hypothetical protein